MLFELLKGRYDVELKDTSGDDFIYQPGGPRSLEIVEAATGEDLHDIGFLWSKTSKIDGIGIRVLRIGMAGSLAYEVHGNFKDCLPVYNALIEAGRPFGLRKLGRHAYWNTHTENGFPQNIIHFFGAIERDPEYFAFISKIAPMLCGSLSELTGSCGPSFEERYVNPFELGWGKAVDFNHDFVGKEALQRIKDSNHRVMVTLEWDTDDVVDVWKSGLVDGEPYAPIDGPEDMLENGEMEYRADRLLADGKYIGISTGRIHSWFYKRMLSLCVVDADYAKIGTRVTILWGSPDQNQKEIRATVARFPYMDTDRNESVDVNAMPRLGT